MSAVNVARLFLGDAIDGNRADAVIGFVAAFRVRRSEDFKNCSTLTPYGTQKV